MFHRRLVLGALLLAGVIGCEKAGSTNGGWPSGRGDRSICHRANRAGKTGCDVGDCGGPRADAKLFRTTSPR